MKPSIKFYESFESGNCSGYSDSCPENSAIYYGYLYVMTPLTVVGMALNVCSMAVFASPAGARLKCHCRHFIVFLQHLCVSDFLALLFLSPLGVCRCVDSPHDDVEARRTAYEAYVFTGATNTFMAVSVWITAAMTIERCAAVVRMTSPTQNQFNSTIHKLVAGFYVASVILNVPFYFEMTVSSDGEIIPTPLTETLAFQVWFWTRAFAAKYIPIVVVIVCNVIILALLQRAAVKRRKAEGSNRMSLLLRQKFVKSVPVLLAVSVTFVCCHGLEPFMYTDVVSGDCASDELCYHGYVAAVNTLEVLAASTNFVFYCALNADFRAALCQLVRAPRKPRRIHVVS